VAGAIGVFRHQLPGRDRKLRWLPRRGRNHCGYLFTDSGLGSTMLAVRWVFMNLGASLLLLLPLSATIGFTPEPQSAQNQTPRDSSPPACAVTVPNQSQPPVKNFGGTVTYSPDYKGPRDGPVKDSYGNGKLWTILWSDGTVVFQPDGPGFIDQDGSLSMKWPWYRGVQGRLTIRGKRLDGTAPPLADIPAGYRDTGFQATALIFPTEGCWEVTGQVGETTLTFVTRVIRLKESK